MNFVGFIAQIEVEILFIAKANKKIATESWKELQKNNLILQLCDI
jgi:hypothetical protein